MATFTYSSYIVYGIPWRRDAGYKIEGNCRLRVGYRGYHVPVRLLGKSAGQELQIVTSYAICFSSITRLLSMFNLLIIPLVEFAIKI